MAKGEVLVRTCKLPVYTLIQDKPELVVMNIEALSKQQAIDEFVCRVGVTEKNVQYCRGYYTDKYGRLREINCLKEFGIGNEGVGNK